MDKVTSPSPLLQKETQFEGEEVNEIFFFEKRRKIYEKTG